MKKGITLIALLSGAILMSGVILQSCKGSKEGKDKKAPGRYKVIAIKSGDAVVYTSFPAQIESENVVEIYSRATGYIQQIYVAEGDNVKKGSSILRVSDADYRQAVNSTNAAYNNALLEVKKLQPLVEKGIISPYQLQTAQSNLQAAKATYENARINLGYTLIKSPVSGVVGRITLKPGSLLTSGLAEPITTVAANGNAFAYFSFDEKKLLQLADSFPGSLKQKVAKLPQVDLILADGQIYDHKGKLELGSSLIDPTTGSLQLKAVFANPKALLRTGSSGTVRIPAVYNNVLIVPQKATYEIQDKKMVYKVDAQGIIHATNIIVANNTSDSYIVTSGISAGDKIVLEGINRLKDGDKIIPMSMKK
jgi:membrane fusion protein (multidrug efflux system)